MNDPLLEIIPGEKTVSNLNRQPDIHKNIANVRKEFYGKPEVCHRLVSHIIHLRRNPKDWEHRQQFWTLLTKYKAVFLKEYDVRWLLSILDTIVDVGNHVQSAIAMNIVQCINGTNIHMSLLVNAVNGDLDGNKLQHEIKAPTWGGMQCIDVPNGDMVYNMMKRLDKVVKHDDLLNEIWCEIKERGRDEHNVIMNHICKASRHSHQKRYFQ